MSLPIGHQFKKAETTEPGIAKQIGGGLFVGLHRDPIAGFFIDQAADILPGVERKDIEDLEGQLQGKTLAEISEFVGEWGTTIGIGMGAYGAGRLAARAGLRMLAPRLSARGAADLIGRQAQTFMRREAANIPGATGFDKLLRPGGLERGVEMVGGALGAGVQGGTGTALQGGDITDVAESAAVAAVLTGATEGAIYGASRVISPRFKAGGVLNKEGEIQGLKEAIALRNSLKGKHFQVSDVQSNPKMEAFDARDPEGGIGLNVPSMSGRPVTNYVKREVSGLGADLSKAQGELDKLLNIQAYEDSLHETSPLGGKQLELFPTAAPEPLAEGQLGISRAVDPKARRAIRDQYFEGHETKPKLDFIPGMKTPDQRALSKEIEVKHDLAGNLRGKLLGEKELFEKATVEQLWNSQTTYDSESYIGGLRAFMGRMMERPVAAARHLSMPGKRAVEVIDQAETTALIAKESFADRLYKDFSRIAQLTGKTVVAQRKDKYLGHYDTELQDIFHAVEKFGPEKASKMFNPQAITIITQLQEDLGNLYRPLVKLGAQPMLEGHELAIRGNATWLPHVGKQTARDVDNIFDRTVEAVKAEYRAKGEPLSDDLAETLAIRRVYNETGQEGLKQFGSIDKTRDFSGSLVEQMQHFEMEGYATGIFRYATETARRKELAKYFGLDGQLKDNILAMARKEGADVGSLNAILSHFLGPKKYYNPAMQAWSRRVINLQAATKLTMAVIPNIFQPFVNNPTSLGFINTLRGISHVPSSSRSKIGGVVDQIPLVRKFLRTVNSADEETIVKSIALNEEYLAAARHIHSRNPVQDTTTTDNIADWALKLNGFTASERFNRMGTGIAALLRIREAVTKGVVNRVKGKHLDFTRRQFRSIGLDYDDIVRAAKGAPDKTVDDVIGSVAGKGSLERSVFNLVRETQFTPSQTTIPLFWQTPHGRVLTQFKSFALQQGIMVRDHILAEAALGNLRPMAMATAIYPVTGKVVYDTLAAVKDRKRDATELGRFLSTVSSVGGFGLTSSLVLSAYYGRLGDALLGPTATDIFSFGQAGILDIMNGDLKHTWKRVESQPVYTATRAMAKGAGLTIEQGIKTLGTVGYSDVGDVEETTFEQLIRNRKQ